MYDRRRILLVVGLTLVWGSMAGPTLAGEHADSTRNGVFPAGLRAALLYEGLIPFETAGPSAASGRRSTPLAFGLSAAVPGLGQAYNRQWVKAAVALAVEAALVVGYTTWRSQGNDAVDAYQAYAHRYWSPTRYASWLNDFVLYLEEIDDASVPAPPINSSLIDQVRAIDFSQADAWTSAERDAVRMLIDQIRALEGAVYHPETGASFSHKLPYFGEQQYYELIGKYLQFGPGWEDYPDWGEPGQFNEAIDPERTGADGTKPNIQGRMLEYAQDHASANDYLRRASRLSILFIANHFLAAVDAAVFAKLHNDRIQAQVRLGQDLTGNVQPMASVSVRL